MVKNVEIINKWYRNLETCGIFVEGRGQLFELPSCDKKRKQCGGTAVGQSTNGLDGHRGIQIKQLAPKQDIDYKISQGTKGRQGNDSY